MIPIQYRARHIPGCACVVCWTNAFHLQMTQRNEQRAERTRQILANPRRAMEQIPAPEQIHFLTILDEVSQ